MLVSLYPLFTWIGLWHDGVVRVVQALPVAIN